MMETRQAPWLAAGVLLLAFLLAPLVLLVLFSFTSRGIANFPLEQLSLQWWRDMVANRQFWPAFTNSVVVAVAVGIISSVIGTMAAFGILALPPRRATLAMAIFTLPVILPPLMLAVALLSFFVSIKMKLRLLTVIASHVLFTQPIGDLLNHRKGHIRSLGNIQQ